MSRKLKPTKFAHKIKDEQVGLMLSEIEKDIDSFKIVLRNKDKQLVDLKKMLKAGKTEYQKIVEENKYLKEYTVTSKEKKEYKQKRQIKKQKICKKIVYETECDGEIENIDQEIPETEIEEI